MNKLPKLFFLSASVLILWCALLVLSAGASPQAGITGDQESSKTPLKITESSDYKKNCAKCHGTNATGRHFAGPSLKSEKASAATSADLADVISKGKGRMPAFKDKLTPDQINALAVEIKAFQGTTAKE